MPWRLGVLKLSSKTQRFSILGKRIRMLPLIAWGHAHTCTVCVVESFSVGFDMGRRGGKYADEDGVLEEGRN